MDFAAIVAGSFMNKDIVCLETDVSLADAREILVQKGISGAPVVDKSGHVVGVFSKSDLIREESFESVFQEDGSVSLDASSDFDPSSRYVGEVISPKLVVTSEETCATEVARLMVKHSVHRVVVVRDRKPVGMVSAFDILKLI